MTGRDRIVLMVVVVARDPRRRPGCWSSRRSARRHKAAAAEVASAQCQLAKRRRPAGQRAFRAGAVHASYATMVSLGKAVPLSQEVPSLIYQLEKASNQQARRASHSIVSTERVGRRLLQPPEFELATPGADCRRRRLHPDAVHVRVQRPLLLDSNTSSGSSTASRSGRHVGGCWVSGRLLTIQSVKLAPLTVQATAKTS